MEVISNIFNLHKGNKARTVMQTGVLICIIETTRRLHIYLLFQIIKIFFSLKPHHFKCNFNLNISGNTQAPLNPRTTLPIA